jgi:hypothetical protein
LNHHYSNKIEKDDISCLLNGQVSLNTDNLSKLDDQLLLKDLQSVNAKTNNNLIKSSKSSFSNMNEMNSSSPFLSSKSSFLKNMSFDCDLSNNIDLDLFEIDSIESKQSNSNKNETIFKSRAFSNSSMCQPR